MKIRGEKYALKQPKKICAVSSLYLAIGAPAVLQAVKIDCEEATFPRRIKKENGMYAFKATQSCTVTGSSAITFAKLKGLESKVFKNDPNVTKVELFSNGAYNGEPAVHVIMEQQKDTGHGVMRLKADLYLNYDAEDKEYTATFKTRRIRAEGNAKNTKEILDLVTIKPEKNNLKMDFTRTVMVTKPWYAPKDIFISSAKKGIKENLHEVTDLQKSILDNL